MNQVRAAGATMEFGEPQALFDLAADVNNVRTINVVINWKTSIEKK